MEKKNKNARKVVCIHHGVGIGGAPLSLLFLLQSLDRASFNPKVLCLYDSEAVNLFQSNGIDIRVLNAWRPFSHTEVYWIKWNRLDQLLLACVSWIITAFFYARRILREEKPDIVYLNSTPLSAWAVAAKSLNIPVVCHVREPIQRGYFGIRKFFLISILKRNVDRFIVISRQNASTLNIPEKTKIIHCFVHFQQFDRNIKPADVPQKKNKDLKIVLYLGGASVIKGFNVVIDALEYLNPGILVMLAGYYQNDRTWKGGLRRLLQPGSARLLAKLESAPNVSKIGVLRNIPPWIASCDILISPFVVPHFARPIIEAGAMGKAVIASDVDGMEELVVNGQTGILIPVGNPLALAEAINKLCGDEHMARSMGESGYERAKMLFNAEYNARATVEVFGELLSNTNS